MNPGNNNYNSNHEGWIYFAYILAFLQFLIFLLLRARLGFINIFIWIFGPFSLLLISSVIFIVGIISLFKRPFLSRQRGFGFLSLIAVIVISQFVYQVYPSSHDNEISSVKFRLPLDGPVSVSWGGSTNEVNYHVGFPDQRWAYDLTVRRDG